MGRRKTDWADHISKFRASSQTIAGYCASARINLGTFRHYLYKKNEPKKPSRKKQFQEYALDSELVIRRDPFGVLTISGFELSHLSEIVGAWSHAVSK